MPIVCGRGGGGSQKTKYVGGLPKKGGFDRLLI